MAVRKNIFVADDILIKTGFLLLFPALAAGLILWPAIVGEGATPAGTWTVVLIFFVLVLMPTAFLVAGYRIRAKEKKIHAVWSILERTLEASIGDLAENTGLEKDTIEKALREIDRRGNAYFIYDRPSGWIFDGRLKSQTVSVNNCPACGHSIGVTIPLVVTKLPRCSYCRSPLDISHINRLKQERIQSILAADQASAPSAGPGAAKSGFSWTVFVLLLLVFWPSALVYAYAKSGKSG